MSVEDIETITLRVDYEDINDTTENNFKKAYNIIDEAVGPLEIVNERCYK